MDSLVATLAYAKTNCGYYQGLDRSPCSLEQFPVINRSILKANMGAFLTASDDTKLSLLDSLQGGSRLKPHSTASEFKFSENIFIEQTSGSSGVPLRIAKTAAERSRLSLAAWRCRLAHDPQINPRTFLPLFHRALDTPLQTSPFDSSPSGVVRFYEWLNANQFRWIHAPPALIGYHANILRSVRVRTPAPALKFIEVSGSRPDESTIAIIKDVIGSTIINQYGTRETWAIGYAEELDAFEINTEAVHVELLNDEGKIITKIGEEGSIVVTSKILRLLPIIRYNTGDRGSWVERKSSMVSGKAGHRIRVLPERDLNMLPFKGKWISGNILFKDVLHKIDHSIGYGYAKYMQIRKVGKYDWRLIVCQCDRPAEIFSELNAFLLDSEPRSRLEMTVIPEMEGKLLAERKPHLFVNEWDRLDHRSY